MQDSERGDAEFGACDEEGVYVFGGFDRADGLFDRRVLVGFLGG